MHHSCTVSVFQWHKHTFHQCKVQCTLFEQYNNMTSWCEPFSACAWTHEKAKSIRQAPITLLIAHLQKIASPPALLHEPSPTLASANNLSILKKLKCALCSNVLSQPLSRIDVQCTGMHQVPHRVHSSIWRCELSLLLRR